MEARLEPQPAPTSDWRRWIDSLLYGCSSFEVERVGYVRAADWDMGPRRLPEHMLHCVVSGGQQGEVGGRPVHTEGGAVLFVPAGTEQRLRSASGGLEKYYIRFVLGESLPPNLSSYVYFPDHRLLHMLFEHIHRRGPKQSNRDLQIRLLLGTIFAEWENSESSPGPEAEQEALSLPEQQHLRDLVHAHPRSARLKPADLSDELGMGERQFRRRFRSTFGESPRTWLVRTRLQEAAQLLTNRSLSVAAIAEEFGYTDPFLFSRQFRRYLGLSPEQWRRSALSRRT